MLVSIKTTEKEIVTSANFSISKSFYNVLESGSIRSILNDR